MARASRPSASRRKGWPSRPVASRTTRSGRATSPYTSGMERHPSSARLRPSALTTTGFTIASRASSTPTTATRRATPTWLAARPTPLAASMVSKRSSIRRRTSASTPAISSLRWRSTGEPRRWRSSVAISGTGRHRLANPHDASPLHHQGSRPALDGHPVFLEVLDLADDPAGGGDIVPLLEPRQDLGVLLPRHGLGTDQQEVEDQDDRPELEHQDGDRAAGTAVGGSHEAREQGCHASSRAW